MAKSLRLFILGLVLGFTACSAREEKKPQPLDLQPTVILISVDGFRWDYLDKFPTPTFNKMAAEGVRAKALIPAFPTKTFPNHYTIVTGLYPAHHGIVANTMYDMMFDTKFSLSKRDAVSDGRWWEGEPLWVTAEKQGQRSGILFWPGSEAEIAGVRPTYWKVYDDDFRNPARVDTVLAWLDMPIKRRPIFLTLYFSDVDNAGHRHGPEAPEVKNAITEVDQLLARLLDGLKARGIENRVNIIVVSDHGMTPVTLDRVIYLDDYLNLDKVNLVDWSPVLAIWPREMSEAEIYQKLAGVHPHLQVYRKQEIPERWHYQSHRRIAPIIGVADDGWMIARHGAKNLVERAYTTGEHGFDNQLPAMRAIFLARGPAFKSGVMVEPFQNIHLYSLICDILKLMPAPNDGKLDSVRTLLR